MKKEPNSILPFDLGNILDALPYYVILVDEDHRILYANKYLEQQFNVKRENLYGEYCPKVIHNTDLPFPGCPLEESVEKGGCSIEREYFIEDRKQWITSSIYPTELTTKEGKRIFIHTTQDITDKKNLEETLKRSYDEMDVFNYLLNLHLKDVSLSEILNQTLEKILTISWLSLESMGGIFLIQKGALKLSAQKGLSPEILETCKTVNLEKCLCGKAASSGEVIYAQNLDDRHDIAYSGITDHGHYCIPILSSDKKVIGVINTYLRAGHKRDAEEEDFLKAVANVLAGIIERSNVEAEKQRLNRRMLDIIEFLPDPVFVVDQERRVIAWNREMELLTGVSGKEILGKGDFEYSIPFYGKRRPILIDLLFDENEFSKREYDYIQRKGDALFAEGFVPGLRGGRGLYIWGKASPLYDQNGEMVGAIESLRDITDRKQSEEKIRYLSYHDKMTDLFNRAFFEEEMKRLDSEREIPISFILGDLNNLKMTNDVFGHQVGDKLLITISKILKDCCRSSDIICRWGGDEFLILLPRTDHETALTIIERIRKSCDAVKELPIRPYVALGSATKEEKTADIISVLQEAEDMMYHDKIIEGKNASSDFVEAVKKTMQDKSYETKEHTEQLKKIATAMAKELGLSDTEIKELSLLAVLHDIGKVAVPESILSKPGSLSAFEWNAVIKHPEIGYRITQVNGKLKTISDAILSHHERWDGKGYPNGLSGERIPLNARIMAIVETYDVMTSGTIYKAACRKEDAIKEIVAKSGTQFDPSLVRVFLKVTRTLN